MCTPLGSIRPVSKVATALETTDQQASLSFSSGSWDMSAGLETREVPRGWRPAPQVDYQDHQTTLWVLYIDHHTKAMLRERPPNVTGDGFIFYIVLSFIGCFDHRLCSTSTYWPRQLPCAVQTCVIFSRRRQHFTRWETRLQLWIMWGCRNTELIVHSPDAAHRHNLKHAFNIVPSRVILGYALCMRIWSNSIIFLLN